MGTNPFWFMFGDEIDAFLEEEYEWNPSMSLWRP